MPPRPRVEDDAAMPRQIDVHAHFLPPPYVEAYLAREMPPRLLWEGEQLILDFGEGGRFPLHPEMVDLDRHLEAMAAAGADASARSLRRVRPDDHPRLPRGDHDLRRPARPDRAVRAASRFQAARPACRRDDPVPARADPPRVQALRDRRGRRERTAPARL